jgi:hypothetical protein
MRAKTIQSKIQRAGAVCSHWLRSVVRWVKRNYHEYEYLANKHRADAWVMYPENLKYRGWAYRHYVKAKRNGSNITRT